MSRIPPVDAEAIADIYESLASPMTARGLQEETGRDLSEILDVLDELYRLGRITRDTRGEYRRRGSKTGHHPARAQRLEIVRDLLARQGSTTAAQVAQLTGVGREAARGYLEDVGAVPSVEHELTVWRVPHAGRATEAA